MGGGSSAPPPGLRNLGNTCYANALVQALLAVPIFTTAVLKNVSAGRICNVSDSIRTLFIDMILMSSNDKTNSISPRAFISAIQSDIKCITNATAPQDAHEAMVCILEAIERSAPPYSLMNDVIKGGRMRTVTRCLECKACWASPASWQDAERFTCIILPLPQKNHVSSSLLLRSYLGSDTVGGWKCEKCGCTVNIERRIQLQTLPRVLVLCVPYLGTSGNSKTHRAYPSRQFIIMQPSDENADRSTSVTTRYNLFSMVEHRDSNSTGHYVAYARHRDTWYECDDDVVREVSWDDITRSGDRNIYMMIYEAETIPTPSQAYKPPASGGST